MGQAVCTPEEFIKYPIFSDLIDTSTINKVIMRIRNIKYFDSEGYPIQDPDEPVWFTDQNGISTYESYIYGSKYTIKEYKFKKDTNYNLINVTNVEVNDFNLLTEYISMNDMSSDQTDKMLLKQEAIESMVECVIRKLKKNGEMDPDGNVTTQIRGHNKTITERELKKICIKGERGKDGDVERYLFKKIFEELDNFGILEKYNIIGFYNGISWQEEPPGMMSRLPPLPSEIIILSKYVKSSMDVFEPNNRTDDQIKRTKRTKSSMDVLEPNNRTDDQMKSTKRTKTHKGGSKKNYSKKLKNKNKKKNNVV